MLGAESSGEGDDRALMSATEYYVINTIRDPEILSWLSPSFYAIFSYKVRAAVSLRSHILKLRFEPRNNNSHFVRNLGWTE
jgi:hypothetical protein